MIGVVDNEVNRGVDCAWELGFERKNGKRRLEAGRVVHVAKKSMSK